MLDIATDSGGGAYLAAMTGSVLYAPPGAQGLEVLPGLAAPASTVLIDDKGALLVGTAGAGVFEYRWDTASFAPMSNETLESSFVHSLLRDQKGALWVGTNNKGAHRLVPGTADHDDRNRLHARLITDMLEDREGSLWITTNGTGVLRLVDHRLHTVSARHGLAYENVWSIIEDTDGALLVGTGGDGIYKLYGDRAGPLEGLYEPLDEAVILSMYLDREGVL